ncbi:MAG: Membrane protein containing DoxX domain [uncultured Sulfurovum sp.]|uniref:Membrane protein containing DoxX domain n=1 Tax=uncultured Sulfurovum sp. TaxID=269237 RepID=A0A6S6U3E6_9BACT|nr:MAG: Membrane protein containing DoxX domain [uncultured Sulfurovum sp.]
MEKKAINFLAICLAVLLLFHGVDKIVNGVGNIVNMLNKMDVPYAQYVAYAVYVGEVFAPLLIIFNHYLRIALILIAINMVVAIVLAHGTSIMTLNDHGAWSIETPMLYLVVAITLFFLNTPPKLK